MSAGHLVPSIGSNARSWWYTMAFIALCAVTSVYFTAQLDIGLYDETSYLERGIAIDDTGLPTADMAPLYSLWYRLLQVLIADPVYRYFVNYAMLIALLPIGVHLLLRQLKATQAASLVGGTLVLFSTLNVLNWPRVSAFALVVLMLGLLLYLRSKVPDRGWAYLFAATAICAYVRPEFTLSVVGIGILWAVDLVRRHKSRERQNAMYPAAALLFGMILFWAMGNPFGSARSMVAFGQHYALNWTEAHKSELDPWTNWEAIYAKDFGAANTMGDALKHAPDQITWHITRNVRSTVPTIVRMLVPAGARPDRWATLLLIALLGTILWSAWAHKGTHASTGPTILGPFIALAMPALLSVIIIHPRQHYLIFPVVLLLLPLVATAYPEPSSAGSGHRSWTAFILVGMILLIHGGRPIGKEGRPTLATIRALQQEVGNKAVVLDADGGYAVYLPPGSSSVTAQQKAGGFNAFRELHRVDVIVASERLVSDERFSTDPEWQAFLDGGYRPGYEVLEVRGTGTRLFVAK